MKTKSANQAANQAVNQANQRLIRRLLLIVVGMFGFGFAMVPLYDVFCDITGLNGKTSGRSSSVERAVAAERTVTVEFVANLGASAPWEFQPRVVKMKVHPGEFYQTSFFARNLTDQTLVGQAIPSVSPGLAAQHFHKIECFCFTRQAFEAGEGRDMPLMFQLDPKLSPDIATVTLAYTFFQVEDQEG